MESNQPQQVVQQKTVWPKIARIKETLSKIKKSDWKWNSAKLSHAGFPYKYRTFNTLMSKISPELAKEDLHLFFQSRRYNQNDSVVSGNRVDFDIQLVVVSTKEGDGLLPITISSPATGEDNDTSKALGKAYTYAKRYLLLNLFSLSDDVTTVEEVVKPKVKQIESPEIEMGDFEEDLKNLSKGR